LTRQDTSLQACLLSSIRDLMPILLVIACFQILVVGTALPNLAELLQGLVFVVLGLTLFVYGLETGVFPMGERLVGQLSKRGSLSLLLIFGFALGFASTVAEPALIAITAEAAQMAAAHGQIGDDAGSQQRYAITLRLVVALAVGFAVVLGIFRILKGWPLHWLIVAGYLLALLATRFAPDEIIAIAYDSGGVTTSTITVPLVTVLGTGLAASIRGRNPATDGFGIIALASVTPMLFVLCYGMVML
jgi:hypothetical protein